MLPNMAAPPPWPLQRKPAFQPHNYNYQALPMFHYPPPMIHQQFRPFMNYPVTPVSMYSYQQNNNNISEYIKLLEQTVQNLNNSLVSKIDTLQVSVNNIATDISKYQNNKSPGTSTSYGPRPAYNLRNKDTVQNFAPRHHTTTSNNPPPPQQSSNYQRNPPPRFQNRTPEWQVIASGSKHKNYNPRSQNFTSHNRFNVLRQDDFPPLLPPQPPPNKFKLIEMPKGDDLFSSPVTFALAHCVGADFQMGKGIAVTFAQKFSRKSDLLNQNKTIGEVAMITNKNRKVFYLVTKDKSSDTPQLEDVIASIKELKTLCSELNIRQLAIPRLACGLDKQEWPVIKDVIKNIFKDSDIEIRVYYKPNMPSVAPSSPSKQNVSSVDPSLPQKNNVQPVTPEPLTKSQIMVQPNIPAQLPKAPTPTSIVTTPQRSPEPPTQLATRPPAANPTPNNAFQQSTSIDQQPSDNVYFEPQTSKYDLPKAPTPNTDEETVHETNILTPVNVNPSNSNLHTPNLCSPQPNFNYTNNIVPDNMNLNNTYFTNVASNKNFLITNGNYVPYQQTQNLYYNTMEIVQPNHHITKDDDIMFPLTVQNPNVHNSLSNNEVNNYNCHSPDPFFCVPQQSIRTIPLNYM